MDKVMAYPIREKKSTRILENGSIVWPRREKEREENDLTGRGGKETAWPSLVPSSRGKEKRKPPLMPKREEKKKGQLDATLPFPLVGVETKPLS